MQSSEDMSRGFRPEIAGLRALAVISVLLFHLKVPGLQGGFAGVDVFFVISGYLISRNILTAIDAGRFTFTDFYMRRTRRIYPALIFTVVATFVAGALWCSPSLFRDVAKESTHALLSISNIQYWREAQQYFAPTSDDLALLHVWSLSLEEQFYLVWPALMVLACRTKRPFAVIAVIGIVSLLGTVAITRVNPSAAFFLMPFRMFEFAIGALCLWYEGRYSISRIRAEWLTSAGLVAIVASVLLFRSDLPYVEAAMVLPCLGAAAIICARSQARSSLLLTNRAAMAVGAISYSLYLCHWPIIFFARFIFGEAAETPSAIVYMLLLMLVVGALMYRFVERPFIDGKPRYLVGYRANATAFGCTVLALVALTHSTFRSDGAPWRLPQDITSLTKLQGLVTMCPYDGSDCRIGDRSGPVAFTIVGDSFAHHYLAGLDRLLAADHMSADVSASPGCLVLIGTARIGALSTECRKWKEVTLPKLAQSHTPLVIVQNWRHYTANVTDYQLGGPALLDKLQASIEATVTQLGADGRRILIVGEQVWPQCAIKRARLLPGPLPHAADKPCPLATPAMVRQANEPIDRILRDVRAKWPSQVELLFPVDYFCDEFCPVTRDGIWLYDDAGHFTVAGSYLMAERSAKAFRQFIAHNTQSLQQSGSAAHAIDNQQHRW